MKRRHALILLVTIGASKLALGQSDKVYRIGFLGTAFASGYVREIEWIREGRSSCAPTG